MSDHRSLCKLVVALLGVTAASAGSMALPTSARAVTAGGCSLLTSPAGDALNNAFGGDGSNVDNLDIIAANGASDGTGGFTATIQLRNLSRVVPANATSLNWYFQWRTGTSDDFAEAAYPSASPSAPAGTVDYNLGTYDYSNQTYTVSAATSGSFTPGPGGVITIDVPAGELSGVAAGTLLERTYASSWIQGNAQTFSGSTMIDRGPKADGTFGASYDAGATCTQSGFAATWNRLPTVQAPAARFGECMAPDGTGTVIMFGGADPHQTFGDTWLFDGVDWVLQQPAHTPPARYQCSMAYDDAVGGAVMFGGDGSNNGALADTWIWKGGDWTQARPTVSPPSRARAGLAYLRNASRMVLFGGYGETMLNDTWTFDGSTWAPVVGVAIPPSPRDGAAMTGDLSHQDVVLFGGHSTTAYLADTWTFDGSTWTQRSPAAAPTPRSDASLTYVPATGTSMLEGGYRSQYVQQDDTWTWDGSTWTQQHPAQSPPFRAQDGASLDPTTGGVLILDGAGAGVPVLHDQWRWDGSNWSYVSFNVPQERNQPSFADDPAAATDVLFGGAANYSYLNDTWTYDGQGWTEHPEAVAPPVQASSGMAYDPTSRHVILLGRCPPCDSGSTGTLQPGQTWSWDGSSWTQLNPSPAPIERQYPAMAEDPATQSILLFGGQAMVGTQPVFDDTWIWHNGAWTQMHPAHNPPPADQSGLAYDPASGQMILFGGIGSTYCLISGCTDDYLGQTWAWDGSDWTQLTPPISPVRRSAPVMAADSQTGGLVLFGGNYGYEAAGAIDETWARQGGEWAKVQTAGSPGPIDGEAVAESPSGAPTIFGGACACNNYQLTNTLWTLTIPPGPEVGESPWSPAVPLAGLVAALMVDSRRRRTRRRSVRRHQRTRLGGGNGS